MAYTFPNFLGNQADYGDGGMNDTHKNQVTFPSPVIKDFIEWSMGIDVTLIDNYIDTTKYSYQPERKKSKIAYIARKDTSGETLRCIFERKGGLCKSWEWAPLSNLSEEEYSRQLAESKIFLATSSQEGMNISVLEAMASGCVVVGFSGVGGNDYMIGSGNKQNCFLAESGNLPEFGKTLERVIVQWDNDKHIYDLLIANGIETARRFQDFDREGKSLKRYFQSFG